MPDRLTIEPTVGPYHGCPLPVIASGAGDRSFYIGFIE